MIIEITMKNGKHAIVGSMYRSPNSNEKNFTRKMENLVHKIHSEKIKKEIIFGMDHNMDLLKSSSHSPTQEFLDSMINN